MTIGELEESGAFTYRDLERGYWRAMMGSPKPRTAELPTMYMAEEAFAILLKKLDVTLEQARAHCNVVFENGFVTVSPFSEGA